MTVSANVVIGVQQMGESGQKVLKWPGEEGAMGGEYIWLRGSVKYWK